MSVKNVLLGLKERREMMENLNKNDSLGDLFEDIEYESMGDVDLNERAVVTFDGRANPREGWACILSGGPGSGKGFSFDNQVLIDGKIIDVDELKRLYSLVSEEDWDFNNPDDVFQLHKIIKAKGWKHDLYNNFFNANDRLGNIIFDITGKTLSSLKTYTSMCKDIGYKTSLVWVVTNRMWAMFRNMNRDRVVPEDVFHEIHNLLKDSIFNFLDINNIGNILDECWVIFSGGTGTYSGESPVDSARDLQGTVHKIEKRGGRFVIPDNLKRDIIMHLGPDEPSPGNPQRYKNFDDVRGDIDNYQDGDEIDMLNHDQIK